MPTPAQQQHAQRYPLRIIRFQEPDGHAPLRGQPVQPTLCVEGEVLPPPLAPRMKEGDNEAVLGVDGGEVRSLLQVTADATQTEVVHVVGSMVLLSDDMIDLMREDRRFLREPAIFAGSVGAPLDERPHIPRDRHEAARRVQRSSA